MADYQVAQDAISVHRKTTVAGVVDTITFAGRRTSVEIMNYSAGSDAFLFFTSDGSVPVVDGERTGIANPGSGVEIPDTRPGNETVIRLISPVPALYSVTAAAFR